MYWLIQLQNLSPMIDNHINSSKQIINCSQLISLEQSDSHCLYEQVLRSRMHQCYD
ncbi:hypothetical protein EJF18_10574 [Clavispora lusitaniae]|uniref:Uncharacterized protein n=1 Tax=Clavispora lusitaniae TaxID=36911 RepID=A0ACD0WDX9_CLALS|nr:hypothetical protein EJF14_10574 [Clavispora lusitaniae]QFZ31219.1 hypothetical protein EJF16_10574 [Clavispora lusitaniae]QFZ36887.1 hypothetical protein EJF15_10574 [Clavispora lusitaniae]QFZ42571.1 hypothetical protein EJF18_10574 [Clavispora lusitaniae]QFZ48247.1 hypothetical protein EJF17_10574 [Clavispora lusitaniae]